MLGRYARLFPLQRLYENRDSGGTSRSGGAPRALRSRESSGSLVRLERFAPPRRSTTTRPFAFVSVFPLAITRA